MNAKERRHLLWMAEGCRAWAADLEAQGKHRAAAVALRHAERHEARARECQ